MSFLLFVTLFSQSYSKITVNFQEKNLITLKGPIDKTITNKFFIDVEDFNDDVLNIFISSPGGSVMQGMKIVDYIKTLQNCNVTINCYADFAASMAFVILQSCTNRYTLDSGVLMQHQMSLGLDGPIENIKSYFKMITDIENNLSNFQAKRVGLTLNTFNNKIYNDWWISGFTAKEEKVVDDIVDLKCSFPLLKKKSTIEFNNILGNVKFIFSKCPLVRHPLKIEIENLKNDSSVENNLDIFNVDYYLKNKDSIKYYY